MKIGKFTFWFLVSLVLVLFLYDLKTNTLLAFLEKFNSNALLNIIAFFIFLLIFVALVEKIIQFKEQLNQQNQEATEIHYEKLDLISDLKQAFHGLTPHDLYLIEMKILNSTNRRELEESVRELYTMIGITYEIE